MGQAPAITFDHTQGRNRKLVLDRVNFIAPLRETGAPVTLQKDMPGPPKA